MATALGVDIGGSGIKGAVVDLDKGTLVTDRYRVETPQPAQPKPVAGVVADVVQHFEWTGLTGATFPAVVKDGVARSAANVDKAWIGTDVAAALSKAAGTAVRVLNDADAAGLAEVRFGVGRGVKGVVVMVTLGTGIGSGLFVDGTLVPNAELGHIEVDGHDAETRAADSVREREELSWEKWARRVERYLRTLEMLLSPNLIIVGGGVSKKADKWLPHVKVETPVKVAELLNNAGIVGAAMYAAEAPEPKPAARAGSKPRGGRRGR